MTNNDPPLEILADGAACRIAALKAVGDAIDELDDKRRERLKYIMEKSALVGPERLPKEHFKFEERLSIGDVRATKVPIYAFKVHQFRVYASEKHIAGKRTFVCTEAVTKKANKASRADLQSAAAKFRPIHERKE